MVLVMPAVALGRISMFSGSKTQAASSGSPEQERVTNIGAVRFEALTGVIVAMTDPDWPGVSVKVVGATATLKFGMVLVWASTWVTSEMDLRWDPSPT
jgi:hypothetical protein